MPHSLVFNFLPENPIYPEYATGRHLHALFLTAVNAVDSQLATHLHETKTEKAFALSPLQVVRHPRRNQRASVPPILQFQHRYPIQPETPCWWRVSLLDDSLFRKLSHLWLNLNSGQPWHLGAANLHVTSILGTPQSTQPWANAASYAELYENASDRNRRISFQFSTPVAFRQQKYDTALPSPESVFKSLLNSWKKYSTIELPEFSTESIFPCFFKLNTEIAEFEFRKKGKSGKFIGAVGSIDYRILGDVSTATIQTLNTLADYALYSGIGRKTTMGMGMARKMDR
ncbi:CRISPR-associated endoribonuclease Cas6 [Oxynema aestuarii]|uniref:CRISPR-associated endoribonuclease Cas6 n=1 Tax=Oxynema aestuarii AP17 TaxID=2064643 RepID=A0A6H1TU18_9CYAN|nr:CRISPR-associated endoribonuclease Cas6 [Oxynema aestuarii]QIZ69925.1 CRISPR-associated endoribonuclease Cas6 [Oxynema aestuarii AP17]